MDNKGVSTKSRQQDLWQFIATKNNALNSNLPLFVKHGKMQKKLKTANQRYKFENVKLNERTKTAKKRECVLAQYSSTKSNKNINESWKLPPNRYNISKVAVKETKDTYFYIGNSSTKISNKNRLQEPSSSIRSKKPRSKPVQSNEMNSISTMHSFESIYKRTYSIISDKQPNSVRTIPKEYKSYQSYQYQGTLSKEKRYDRPTSRCMVYNSANSFRQRNQPEPTQYNMPKVTKDISNAKWHTLNAYKFCWPRPNTCGFQILQ